jgi:hypothetical protein
LLLVIEIDVPLKRNLGICEFETLLTSALLENVETFIQIQSTLPGVISSFECIKVLAFREGEGFDVVSP